MKAKSLILSILILGSAAHARGVSGGGADPIQCKLSLPGPSDGTKVMDLIRIEDSLEPRSKVLLSKDTLVNFGYDADVVFFGTEVRHTYDSQNPNAEFLIAADRTVQLLNNRTGKVDSVKISLVSSQFSERKDGVNGIFMLTITVGTGSAETNGNLICE